MRDVGKLIRELRLRKGWTLRRLGEAVNKTPAYLSIIENKRKTVKAPLLEQIARALDVEASYFEETGGENVRQRPILKDLQELIDRHTGSEGEPARGARRVPVLSDIAAGEPFSREDPFPVGVADEYIEVPADISDPNAFALRIKGDSMEPRLCEGDVVVVCPSWKVRENRPVVAKVSEDEVTCKIFSRAGETVVLTSLNPKYPPLFYEEGNVVWIYPVARAITNLYT